MSVQHGEVDTSGEEIAAIRLEFEKTKKENEQLEKETVHSKSIIEYLKDSLETAMCGSDESKKVRDAIEIENKDIKEINENLLDDITFINARMIPGKIEEENLDLKETIAILKCHLEMFENEEYMDNNESDDSVKFSDEEEMDVANTKYFLCDICSFRGNSQQGLKIHVRIMHKQSKHKNTNNMPSVS